MKVAVTGATGQIGLNLLPHVVSSPRVDALVAICLSEERAAVVEQGTPGADIRIGSVTDPVVAKRLLSDCDVIVHCARVSDTSVGAGRLNLAMSQNIFAEASPDLVIFLSSVAVYGHRVEGRSTFDNPRPTGPYGKAKLTSEKAAVSASAAKRVDSYFLRTGHVYGALIRRSKVIIDDAREEGFRLPFDGQWDANCIHIDRLSALICGLFDKPVPTGIYNVIESDLTWRRLFDWHTKTVGLSAAEGMSSDESEHWKARYGPSAFPFARGVKRRIERVFKPSPPRPPVDKMVSLQAFRNTGQPNPIYLEDPVPGPVLDIDVDFRPPAELSARLLEWYRSL